MESMLYTTVLIQNPMAHVGSNLKEFPCRQSAYK